MQEPDTETVADIKSQLYGMTLNQIEDIQSAINAHLHVIAIKDRERRGLSSKLEIRIDDATLEELLEEKGYMEHTFDWDPIFNIDKDRVIDGSIEIQYQVSDLQDTKIRRSIPEATPILYPSLSKQDYPPDHVALEFFRQFLIVEADSRFAKVTPEMLLTGFKEFINFEGVKARLWWYIDEINEFGTILNHQETGDEINVDVCDRKKQEIEDWERKQQGKPEVKKQKQLKEEDVHDRTLRKYRKI